MVQSYTALVKRYHQPGRNNRCPWCREEWPCTVYREVVQPDWARCDTDES
jgi:hypothetical protein